MNLLATLTFESESKLSVLAEDMDGSLPTAMSPELDAMMTGDVRVSSDWSDTVSV